MATQTQQQTTPASTDAGATQTTQTTAAAAGSSSFPATPPPAENAPPAEPTQADKAAKMDAITKKMAGEGPAKPAEPEKPKPEAEPAKPKDDTKKSDNKRLSEKYKEEKLRRLDIEGKYAELVSKQKEGEEPSEIDKLKMEQLEEQYATLSKESAERYKEEAQEALGDDFAEVQESSNYYVPLLLKAAPQFTTELAQQENKFVMMRDLFRCFTDGSLDIQKFVALPAPAQIKFLRSMDDAIRNPKPPSASTTPAAPPVQTIAPVQPPKVPVPSDSGVSTPPDNKNAKMAQIISGMAKRL